MLVWFCYCLFTERIGMRFDVEIENKNYMTKEQLFESVLSGKVLATGEYRMSKAEMHSWRDKVNGQAKSGAFLTHTVEVGDVAITLSERVPEGSKIEDIRVPFTKGEGVVIFFDSLLSSKGIVSGRGKLENPIL